MPRCFLAKKSPSASVIPNNGTSDRWSEDDRTSASVVPAINRSTVGSITAAQAVQSIQEPLPIRPKSESGTQQLVPKCSPPPPPPSLERNDNQGSGGASPGTPLVLVKTETDLDFKQEPTDLGEVRCDAEGVAEVKVHMECPTPPATRDPNGEVTKLSRGFIQGARPGMAEPRLERLPLQPLPQEPRPRFPPTKLPSSPLDLPPPLARVRTKEETDAAHDLLELSRSLPPFAGQQQVTITPAYPPTPPTPEAGSGGGTDPHYTTLIYITQPPPTTPLTEFPMTPPSESNPSPSPSEVTGTLTIADGRAKKNKEGKERSKYTCSECGKNYATSSNLSRHKQTHRSLDSNNAKKCPVCGKMYVSMPALSMHILTHNLNHKCHVCGKAFSRPWLLQGHLRSHTGQKPYSCTVCRKSFADRSNLRAHMQTHSPSKNFQCSRCHKTFALKSYLNKHYESSCVKSSSSISPSPGSPAATPSPPHCTISHSYMNVMVA